MSERCKHCGRTIVLWGGDGKLWVHKDDGRAFCSMDDDDNNDRAEPSPEPEAAPEGKGDAERIVACIRSKIEMEGATPEDWVWEALAVLEADGKLKPQPPASEVQAPAVPDELGNVASDLSMLVAENLRLNVELANLREQLEQEKSADIQIQAQIEAMENDNTTLSAELAQLRARVAILDAQEVALRKLANDVFDKGNDNNLAASLQEDKAERVFDSKWEASRLLGWWLEQRERQLLDALRAIQAWREVAYRQHDALRDVLRGNDLAAERRQSIENWPGSDFRGLGYAAIAAYDALAGKGE